MSLFLNILLFALFFLFGHLVALTKVRKIDMDVYYQVVQNDRNGWNRFVDGFKASPKEKKIEELKVEIEELQTEVESLEK